MGRARFTPALSIACLCLLHAASGARGQSVLDEESPRVERLTFRGVRGVPLDVLQDSIVTQATRCRGILLRPLCWLSGSPYFVEYHKLDRAELARDELRIRVVYFRAGYREAQATSSLTPRGDGVEVTFTVTEGPATRISQLTVTQADSVLTSRQLRQAKLPGEGQLLDLNRLDSARIRLRGRLWDVGYGDAQVLDSTSVDRALHTASLRVTIAPGRRTTIDTVLITGNEAVSDRTVRRILGLRGGQLYRRSNMTAAQRRLYETELFRQTLVRVPDEETDSAKTVQVTLGEAPRRAVEVAAGFNTTDFVQGEIRLTRYNLWGAARRLDVRASVGNLLASQLYGKSIFGSAVPGGVGTDVDRVFLEPTWQMGAELGQPFFLGPRAALGIGVSAHRRSIPGIVIDRGEAVNGSFTWRFADRIPGSITYQYERTRVEAGDLYFCSSFGVCALPVVAALRAPHALSPIALTAHAERADDPLSPRTGYIARLDIEHASALTLSDYRYNRVVAEFNRYIPRGRGVFAAHLRVGRVWPSGSTSGAVGVEGEGLGLLHPRKRFYGGGSRSVRGFAENQLGPRVLTIAPERLLQPSDTGDVAPCTMATIEDGSCDPNVAASNQFIPRPLGGNRLIEASVEYRFPLTRRITGATFVDAGSVYGRRLNFPPGDRSAVTPGFGIRYTSPIGPVRVDLAVRPRITEELPVVTEVAGENGQPRLVQLDTPRRYNPAETGGGFLRQLTSRLQLHLAIGEAW